MKKLFIIDGNSYCYRAFYAIKSLSNSRGEPTNAIYGFIAMLNKLIREEKPDYLTCAFDLKGPTFRHNKYKDYKVHRKPMPDDLIAQLPVIKEVISAYNIPIFEMEGFEADDLLATIAVRVASENVKVYIMTSDKDMFQLVNKDIRIYSAGKEPTIYDTKKVEEKYGVPPKQITELLALMGDLSDNIPGVKGIGLKTAVNLITEYSSLEGIYNNLDKIKSKSVAEKLSQNKDNAFMSRELAKVETEVPLDFDIKDLEVKQPNNEKLAVLFKELEFKKMLGSLIEKQDIKKQKIKSKYILIDNQRDFDLLISKLEKQKEITFELDLSGDKAISAELKGFSFCWRKGEVWYIPLIRPPFKVKLGWILKNLKTILENEKIAKTGANVKHNRIVLLNNGIDLKGIDFDVMIAAYLLNPSRYKDDFKDVVFEYMDYHIPKKGDAPPALFETVPSFKDVCLYNDLVFELKSVLKDKLKENNLYSLFEQVEMPLVSVLSDMEFNGVTIDTRLLSKLSIEMQEKITKLTSEIYNMAGCEFNINSPKQLGDVLFNRLKLPIIKKTKTSFSTNVEVLEKLSRIHNLPAYILTYRELVKLKSTYVDSLPMLVDDKTNRIHTSFNQVITATGRLSSSNPNLQNIPVRTEEGKKIRAAFITKSSTQLLVSADYSQIELRILAHLSGDKILSQAFKEELDVHSYTASLIYGVEESKVDKKMRDVAKTVNFGIIYGISSFGLSKQLGISVDEAKSFIDQYFCRYPDVKKYMDKCITNAKEKGYVTTIMNRLRYIPEINSNNNNIRQFAERTAINTPVQGSSADLIKIAMIALHNKNIPMILQVHDELVFELDKSMVEKIVPIIKEVMENVIKLSVPIKVTIKKGKNWLDMVEIN